MIPFRRNKSRRAFTLIELLIVITIIGILAVALIPKIAGAPGRARDAQRKADLNTIAVALEAYYSDFGKYPDEVTAPCLDNVTTLSAYFNAKDFPDDPSNNVVGSCPATNYFYNQVDFGSHYIIGANLENDITSASPGTVRYKTVSTASTLGDTSTDPYKTIATGALSSAPCTATGLTTTAMLDSSNDCIYVIAK